MAIFNKSGKKTDAGATIVANGTIIKGDITGDSTVHIDGVFEGNIDVNSSVSIGSRGNIRGDVIANSIMISGEVSGTIEAKIVEILPNGKMFGKVTAEEFMIEKTGLFEGERKIKLHKEPDVKDVRENEKSLEFKKETEK